MDTSTLQIDLLNGNKFVNGAMLRSPSICSATFRSLIGPVGWVLALSAEPICTMTVPQDERQRHL